METNTPLKKSHKWLFAGELNTDSVKKWWDFIVRFDEEERAEFENKPHIIYQAFIQYQYGLFFRSQDAPKVYKEKFSAVGITKYDDFYSLMEKVLEKCRKRDGKYAKNRKNKKKKKNKKKVKKANTNNSKDEASSSEAH